MEKEKYAENIDDLKTEKTDIEPPKFNPDGFFAQRDEQRRYLFYFAIGFCIFSLICFFGVILLQACLRTKFGLNFEVVSDTALQIIAVSVFGQVFGVVYIIAHALWSNHEFVLMGNRKK